MKIIIFGLSITSSAASGHATTYRNLVTELSRRGHDVLFLERNVPWYAERRDMPRSGYGRIRIYENLFELRHTYSREVGTAACVIIGSGIPESSGVTDWVRSTAESVVGFYDVETAAISFGHDPEMRPMTYGVDPLQYYPRTEVIRWNLATLESYKPDRQLTIEEFMFGAARRWREGRFAVAGQRFPWGLDWPDNVTRITPLNWSSRRDFYNSQQYMLQSDPLPGAHLFEAAACATPIISPYSPALEAVFTPGEEIFFVENAEDVVRVIVDTPYMKRADVGWAARRRVLAEHTVTHRAQTLEQYIEEARIQTPAVA